MANHVWEYAWEFWHGSYSGQGGARITQSPTAPPQQPFMDGVIVEPPPRNPPVVSPAFGKLDSSIYFAYTPGSLNVIPGRDRIINWIYRYLYHGESGYGTCGVPTPGFVPEAYTYGQAAQSPALLNAPDIMAAPAFHLDGWRSMSLRVAAEYQGNGGTWGDKNALTCDTDDTIRAGTATMALERRSDSSPVLDRAGVVVASAPPMVAFNHVLGIIRPPAVWPPFHVRVVHQINTIIVEIAVVAYVRVESDADPPDPPDPEQNIPPLTGPATPTGTPSSVTLGVGGNAILRPPC